MKGWDAVVFPREGEPTLFCVEASADDAARTAWTSDVRIVDGLPRRRSAAAGRADARARRRARGRARDGRARALAGHAGAPTGWSASRRRTRRPGSTPSPARSTRRRCSPRRARSRPTQEVERMRLANEIAAAAMDHVARRDPARDDRGADRRRVARLRPRRGNGLGREGRARARLLARLGRAAGSRPSPRRRNLPVVEGEPTLFEIWVCADGYWADHTKNLVVGELTDRYRELEDGLREVYDDAVAFCTPGREPRRARPSDPRGDRPRSAIRASRPIRSATASARGPTSRRTRTRPGGGEIAEGMVLAIEPGCYWEGGGGLRVEDNFLDHRGRAGEALAVPRRDRAGVTSLCDSHKGSGVTLDRAKVWTGSINEQALDPQPRATGRALRHDAARRRADGRRRADARGEARDRPARSTRPGSTGSRPASRGSPPTTSRRSS